MTYQALTEAIVKLINERQKAQGNEERQNDINKKLDKLYELKYTMIEQKQNETK